MGYDLLNKFAQEYVTEMNNAKRGDDWDEQTFIRREAKRVAREVGRIVQAVDTLTNYGLTIS